MGIPHLGLEVERWHRRGSAQLKLRTAIMASKLTIQQVIKAIARLGDRKGSKYADIHNALSSSGKPPAFIRVVCLLNRAKKDGIVRQNSAGRWTIGDVSKARNREAVDSPSQLGRRRRRRSKKGKAKKKGKKGKKGRKGRKR